MVKNPIIFPLEIERQFQCSGRSNLSFLSLRGRTGLDRMVAGFATSCAINAYYH